VVVGHDDRISVVVATCNRRDELLRCLDELARLPERPAVVVVDNGSTDGTAAAVRARHPEVDVVVTAPLGPAARNVGLARTRTPYVAFADDDSWWAPGSLACAADLLDRHPGLGLLTGQVLVGPERRVDPLTDLMARSPLPASPGLPGVPVMGFMACAAIVRRAAFEAAGGFHRFTRFGGEETLLAADLVSAGWELAYVDDLVAFHHPSSVRSATGRRASELWNRLLLAWLRFPAAPALAVTRDSMAAAVAARCTPLAPLVARRGGPTLRERRVAAPEVLRRLQVVGEMPSPSPAPA
jgi:GT2 family glycosyltransferase